LVRPDVLAEGRAELDLLAHVREAARPRGDLWDATSRLEITGYMRHQLLRDVDAMSMAHSLEVRVPFVDALVTSEVLALPPAVRARRTHKQLLRDAVPQVPACIRERRAKRGFTFPFSKWMAGPLRTELHERVRNVGARLGELLDRQMIAAVLAASDEGRAHWS